MSVSGITPRSKLQKFFKKKTHASSATNFDIVRRPGDRRIYDDVVAVTTGPIGGGGRGRAAAPIHSRYLEPVTRSRRPVGDCIRQIAPREFTGRLTYLRDRESTVNKWANFSGERNGMSRPYSLSRPGGAPAPTHLVYACTLSCYRNLDPVACQRYDIFEIKASFRKRGTGI
ncbi:hypothetical protein EVAR_66162_1 [Eumeta japonica]|uniref:Uncharacterized protein n=1 Tax=Eumeta variegata TaxID=151549 RepID=A0A4C1ZIX6_EUMVA|nr:hypothetical protein EVAR_66162_1 [Eumeta japonica]